jgi:two-component system response regulator DesR
MTTRRRHPKLSVLVACSAAPMRAHLRAMLNREPGLCLCGETDTGTEALELFFHFRPDVVVVDAQLPDPNGFKLVECIKQAVPACRAILLCSVADPCVDEVSRMVGVDHLCQTSGGLDPIFTLLRELAAPPAED